MAEERWNATAQVQPAQEQRVDWLASSGQIVRNGFYKGRLWFLPDEVYVYYTPDFWRPADPKHGYGD